MAENTATSTTLATLSATPSDDLSADLRYTITEQSPPDPTYFEILDKTTGMYDVVITHAITTGSNYYSRICNVQHNSHFSRAGSSLREARPLVSGQSPVCSDCLLSSMEQQ